MVRAYAPPNSDTPGTLAAKSGNLELVKYLLDEKLSNDIYW